MFSVTSVRLKLPGREISDNHKRLLAYVDIVIDNSLVVRDMRLVDGFTRRFIAMPSKPHRRACKECGGTNRLAARFCNDCGKAMILYDFNAPDSLKEYCDIAFPISTEAREVMEKAVIAEYELLLATTTPPSTPAA